MKQLIIALLVFSAVLETVAASECKPKLLKLETLKLIKPLMQLRIRQASDNFTDDGRWKAESPVAPEVEKRFEELLIDRTPTGDEALAYLLNVYMGEHPGEELVCEVINRGVRMLPLIREYQECTPLTGLEPLPKFVRGSGHLPDIAIAGISRGEKCIAEE